MVNISKLMCHIHYFTLPTKYFWELRVGTATVLGAARPRNQGTISEKGKGLSSSPKRTDRLCGPASHL
jgi:hypothetical protein